jgi:DNA-binding CsgD family transcriptional regulator/pimeloyl-ACP methyl ester carboxylesterase
MDAPPLQYAATPDGFSIAYTLCGAGEPLLYMPQPFSHTHLYWRSHNVFRLLYEHLAARFQLICYDSRGLGSSTRGLPANFRIDDFETDLAAVVEKLGLQKFALLAQGGFSRVAIRYSVQHPERVRALILWNPDTGDLERDGWQPSQLSGLASANWDLYVDTMARTGWIPEEAAVARDLVGASITQADWLTRMKAWPQYNVAGILNQVKAPTLILNSVRGSSPYSSEEAGRFIASQISAARLELLNDPGAGLFSLKPEVPPGVLLIESFLREVGPAQPSDSPSSDGLSAREIEVLRLVAAGKSNAQIADELVISQNTVIRHVSNIFAKTGAANRAQAAIYARDHGLA